jgi:hypothetical protein
MMKRSSQARVLGCALGLAAIASLVACVSGERDDGPDDIDGAGGGDGSAGAAVRAVDPTGSWNLRLWFNEACDRPPLIERATLHVIGDPIEYEVVAPEASASATVSCTADRCTLSGVFTWAVGTARFERDVALVLARDGTITGSGTERVRDGAGRCTFTIVADGVMASAPAAGS